MHNMKGMTGNEEFIDEYISDDVKQVTDFFKKLRKGKISKAEVNEINLVALLGIEMRWCCHNEEIDAEYFKIHARIKKMYARLYENADWK